LLTLHKQQKFTDKGKAIEGGGAKLKGLRRYNRYASQSPVKSLNTNPLRRKRFLVFVQSTFHKEQMTSTNNFANVFILAARKHLTNWTQLTN